jgi:3-dehydroquinate dehydratase-2
MIKTFIINGPNLNLLHLRNTAIYGENSLDKIQQQCFNLANQLNIDLDFFQSNHEGEIIEQIQKAINIKAQAIVINPAGYTHTSVAIADALEIFTGYKIEVHLSNIYQREKFRHHSFVSKVVNASIAGCQEFGYLLALHNIFYHIK